MSNEEKTPLTEALCESVDFEKRPQPNLKNEAPPTLFSTILANGWHLLVLIFCLILTLTLREDLPASVPCNASNDGNSSLQVLAANRQADFSGVCAYNNLQNLTSHTRAIANDDIFFATNFVRDHLDALYILARDVLHRDVEYLDGRDNAPTTFIDYNQRNWYFESNNMLFRLHGSSNATNSRSPAILVSGHYDSVLYSPGATDNGATIAIMLEMIRSLLNKPLPDTDIIFLFNNGEESRYLGACAFLKHPWWHDVVAFVNMDGAGAGGRQLLFRDSSGDGISDTFFSAEPHPHGSVLTKELFGLRLIPSDTDFSIYKKASKAGVDLAFYVRRQFYHTYKDSIDFMSSENLQQAGANVLAGTYALASKTYSVPSNSSPSDDLPAPPITPYVFFDIFGHSHVVMSMSNYRALLGAMVALIPCLLAVRFYWYIIRRAYTPVAASADDDTPAVTEAPVHAFLFAYIRAFLVCLVNLFVSLILFVIFYLILSLRRGGATRSNPWLVISFFYFLSMTLNQLVAWAWISVENRRAMRGDQLSSSSILLQRKWREFITREVIAYIWWIICILCLVGASANSGFDYFIASYAFMTMLALFVVPVVEMAASYFLNFKASHKSTVEKMTDDSRIWWSWMLYYAIVTIFPFILTIDVIALVTDALAPIAGNQAGVINAALIFICASPVLLITFDTIPLLHRGGNHGKLAAVLGLITMILFIASIAAPIFTSQVPCDGYLSITNVMYQHSGFSNASENSISSYGLMLVSDMCIDRDAFFHSDAVKSLGFDFGDNINCDSSDICSYNLTLPSSITNQLPPARVNGSLQQIANVTIIDDMSSNNIDNMDVNRIIFVNVFSIPLPGTRYCIVTLPQSTSDLQNNGTISNIRFALGGTQLDNTIDLVIVKAALNSSGGIGDIIYGIWHFDDADSKRVVLMYEAGENFVNSTATVTMQWLCDYDSKEFVEIHDKFVAILPSNIVFDTNDHGLQMNFEAAFEISRG